MLSHDEVADALYGAMNRHDVERVSGCFDDKGVLVTPIGVAEGHEQIAWYYEHLFRAFGDLRLTPWNRVQCDDPAVVEWTLTGTHTGPFLMPDGSTVNGTGRTVAIRGIGACFVQAEKIVTHREYYDQLELYSQLGFALTPTEPA